MYSYAIILPYLYTDGDTKVQICYDIDSDLLWESCIIQIQLLSKHFIQIYHDLSWLVIPNFKPSFKP